MAKKRLDTVEGSYDPNMAGEHFYQTEDGNEGFTIWADDHGQVIVTVECLDAIFAKDGYVRV